MPSRATFAARFPRSGVISRRNLRKIPMDALQSANGPPPIADLRCSLQFFAEFNSKLLESENYITRRQAVKLLGDMLLDRSNSAVMMRYVCSKDNLRILMNLLRESSKNIQIEAFHVFKLFAANQNKPPEIASILVANRSKILRFFSNFKLDKEDEQFEADKAQVIREIASLEPRDQP